MAKISIIIPIYNTEKYIPKCLNSIINQTFKDIEIICINDGSDDNSLRLIKDFATKDGRIKIINQDNKGVSIARNKGIEHSSGTYLLFVDPDDWLDIDACQKIVNKIDITNSDLIFFNHYVESNFITRKINLFNSEQHNNYFLTNGPMWTCCYKKQYIQENKILFPPGICISEDQIFKTLALLHNPSIEILEDALYHYLFSRKNSATKNFKKGINENIKGFDFIKNTKEYKNSTDNIKLLIIDNWAKLLFGMWCFMPYRFLKNDIADKINLFLLEYKSFDSCEYKNLIGYKRLKHKYLIRILKDIRDCFFSLIYRNTKNEKI